jgi:hypothetical protein
MEHQKNCMCHLCLPGHVKEPQKVSCEDCARGDTPVLIDAEGVRCTVSGKPGVFCHVSDVYWWPCKRLNALIDVAHVVDIQRVVSGVRE